MPPHIPAPRASGATSSTVVPLHWAVYGPAGAPQLLVLHGGPGAQHDYLLPQMLRLAERHELIFYDQRGGGRSRTDDRTPITWRTQVDDLAAVIREMQLGQPSIVGYSWGGLLAMLYALVAAGALDAGAEGAPRPPAPARLVLIDPAPPTRAMRHVFEEEFDRRQRAPRVQAMRAELAASGLRERDPDAYRQRQFELSVAGYFADPERAHDLTPFRVTSRVQQSVWNSLGDYDLLSSLHAITCPTLIAHGREDPIPLSASEAIAARLPRAELVPIAGSGHVPYVEAPEPLFAAIDRFLAATDPPARETTGTSEHASEHRSEHADEHASERSSR
ncbi:MAG TPA: alpha/beta fold hydrolase [Gemmatimonadaceae bacterium]|nr:alpha/beta fold hydrolase [Gemmatimonadaceae bacterium]